MLLKRAFFLALFVSALFIGCDDGGSDPEPEEILTPLSFDREIRGIGLQPGDEEALGSKAEELEGAFSHLVIRAQLFDELLYSRDGDSSAAHYAPRVTGLWASYSPALNLDNTVLVLDLMRLSDGVDAGSEEPYLVSWDQNDREIDRYAFWREDYQEALIEQATQAVENLKPKTFVFGAEMERYLQMPGGVDDFANLVTFYRSLYAEIKSVSPDTQVGIGFDWARIQLDLVPALELDLTEIPEDLELDLEEEDTPAHEIKISCDQLPGDPEVRLALERLCSEKGFALYIAPFLQHRAPGSTDLLDPEVPPTWTKTSDIIALSVSPGGNDFGNRPEACPEEFFAALRTWSKDFPVAIYQTQWRSSSAVGFGDQDKWAATLLTRLDGVNVQLIAWTTLKDLLSSECGKLTNDLHAPDDVCFGGLFKDSMAPKDVYTTFTTDSE